MRKLVIGLAVAAAIAAPLAVVAPANSADGDEYIVNGDFVGANPSTCCDHRRC